MSGFRPIDDPSFVGREFDPSNDDEIVVYGDQAGDVPFGFHCVGRYEARDLAMCDWLDDEVRHEHAKDGDEGDFGFDNEVLLDDSESTSYDNIEVVERIVVECRRARTNHPNRGVVTWSKYDPVRNEWVVHKEARAQHCHGGNDTRRYRRGDVTGKMLGNRNAHRKNNCDCGVRKFVPTEVLFITPGPIDGVDYAESVRIK